MSLITRYLLLTLCFSKIIILNRKNVVDLELEFNPFKIQQKNVVNVFQLQKK